MDDFYYTMVPLQLQTEEQNKQSASRLVCYKGVKMYVRPHDEQHYQIVDLCSTDPADYLKAELMPGALIQLFRS